MSDRIAPDARRERCPGCKAYRETYNRYKLHNWDCPVTLVDQAYGFQSPYLVISNSLSVEDGANA